MTTPPYFHQRHPYIAILLSSIVALFLVFAIVESTLHLLGYQAGIITQNRYFKKVRQLTLRNEFIADEQGIQKFNTGIAEELHQYLIQDRNFPYLDWLRLVLNDKKNGAGILKAYDEINRDWVENNFTRFIDSLKNKTTGTCLEVDLAYIDYYTQPINSDGFRSITFKNYNTAKTKVLLLGDSFTWGNAASNLTSSFADLLAAKGYVVFNTGISGADPAQYQAIARQYIPLLKPDIIIVNFFMGNDIMYSKRPIT